MPPGRHQDAPGVDLGRDRIRRASRGAQERMSYKSPLPSGRVSSLRRASRILSGSSGIQAFVRSDGSFLAVELQQRPSPVVGDLQHRVPLPDRHRHQALPCFRLA